LAEMFSDGTRLIVRARVQCRDPGQISGLNVGGRDLLAGAPSVGIAGVSLGPVLVGHHLGSVLVVFVIGAVFILVVVVVAVIVLYQAEIARHRAHRAGHLVAPVMPAKQPALTPRRATLRRTLPDEGPPAAEQRRTDPHECRALGYRILQVTAHARGDGARL